MKATEFTPLVLPTGDIILKPVREYKTAAEKLEAVRKMGLWKTTKSIRQLREEVYDDVGKRFKR